jgi:hypothetical protein
MLVVGFSTWWWIATTCACVTPRRDISMLGNVSHCRIAMLARTLRFSQGKDT